MEKVIKESKYTDLIIRVKGSDTEAWAEIYQESYKPVWFTIKRFIKDDHQAEDILQDTYVQAYQKLDTLESPEAFGKWICMIAANRSKNYLKKKKPVYFNELENDEFDEIIQFEDENITFQPEASMDQAETVRIVNEMLEKLPEKQKIALALHYGSGLSAREISNVMDCKENTAKGYLKYGLEGLRKQKNEMEAKGIKLRSVAFGPFLYWMYHNEIKQIVAKVSSSAIMSSIAGGMAEAEASVVTAAHTASVSAASTTASTTSAQTVASATAKTAISKYVLGAGIAATIGGGAIAGKYGLEHMKYQKELQELRGRIEVELQDILDEELYAYTSIGLNRLGYSDDVERYIELTNDKAVWIPKDTGEGLLGFYPRIDDGKPWGALGYYEGQAKKGKREGKGTFYEYSSFATMYSGDWKNDLPNGEGTYLFLGNENITGNWVDGKADGEMQVQYLGNPYTIVCKEGKLVDIIEESVSGLAGAAGLHYWPQKDDNGNYIIEEDIYYYVEGLGFEMGE